MEASAATTTARGVSFNSPRGKFDAHVMPNDDLVLENAKGAQIVVEAKSVRRVLVLETGTRIERVSRRRFTRRGRRTRKESIEDALRDVSGQG